MEAEGGVAAQESVYMCVYVVKVNIILNSNADSGYIVMCRIIAVPGGQECSPDARKGRSIGRRGRSIGRRGRSIGRRGRSIGRRGRSIGRRGRSIRRRGRSIGRRGR